ncbi:MAG: tRNA uridine-5-carboxymethylaminomethyl(34) synthesis GTPase MnmE [Alphaproteobacteria bacterium]
MTIFALSTAPGRAAIAVIRVSGPAAGGALAALAGGLPAPRRAVLRRLNDPRSGATLDRALVLWLPGPASETGEDMAELHVHGGRAVAVAVLAALARLPGLRPAGPGEFARQAFANGRLDLTAAEGLADLIEAETEAQRAQALDQLEGELGRVYDGWRADLIDAMAGLEAAIDFPDEDLPTQTLVRALDRIATLGRAIHAHLDDGNRGERLRDGFRVAIVGPPNVGKSSLMNRLARRDAAIVAPEPGTTRDIVEVHLDLGGLPVTVADTAGLRETAGSVEREGIARARRWAGSADLKILIGDSEHYRTEPPDLGPGPGLGIAPDRDTIQVVNKIDLGLPTRLPRGVQAISCLTGEGLDALLSVVVERLSAKAWRGAAPPLTRARHRALLEQAAEALERAHGAAAPELVAPELVAPELVAEDLRLAAYALGRITGRVDVEDVLDRLFASFCIGK